MSPGPPPKGPLQEQERLRAPATSRTSRSASAPTTQRTTPAPSLSRDNVSAATVSRALAERRPYLRMAFANPYNLALLFGSLSIAAMVQEPLLALGVLSAEALWLLFGPESKLLQRWLWDPSLERARRETEAQARAEAVKALDPAERSRVEALVERQEQIRWLASQNPSFTGELLRSELSKTNKLVDAFVELAVNCARYAQYLRSVDTAALERDRQRYAAEVRRGAADDAETQIAGKNLEIVGKRLERVEEIGRSLGVARGQLDLIENSFQLIADQIVTMQSPKELSGQLDDLLDGVEAIRETTRDTERILGAIDKEL